MGKKPTLNKNDVLAHIKISSPRPLQEYNYDTEINIRISIICI